MAVLPLLLSPLRGARDIEDAERIVLGRLIIQIDQARGELARTAGKARRTAEAIRAQLGELDRVRKRLVTALNQLSGQPGAVVNLSDLITDVRTVRRGHRNDSNGPGDGVAGGADGTGGAGFIVRDGADERDIAEVEDVVHELERAGALSEVPLPFDARGPPALAFDPEAARPILALAHRGLADLPERLIAFAWRHPSRGNVIVLTAPLAARLVRLHDLGLPIEHWWRQMVTHELGHLNGHWLNVDDDKHDIDADTLIAVLDALEALAEALELGQQGQWAAVNDQLIRADRLLLGRLRQLQPHAWQADRHVRPGAFLPPPGAAGSTAAAGEPGAGRTQLTIGGGIAEIHPGQPVEPRAAHRARAPPRGSHHPDPTPRHTTHIQRPSAAAHQDPRTTGRLFEVVVSVTAGPTADAAPTRPTRRPEPGVTSPDAQHSRTRAGGSNTTAEATSEAVSLGGFLAEGMRAPGVARRDQRRKQLRHIIQTNAPPAAENKTLVATNKKILVANVEFRG
ncbi:MAG: hypothetical protein J2P19_35560, partial [Pseudonocardia sp.]|nr:hypothetical protein [Pseudonocardia sp.]